jgi:uncharacterized membrane protein YeaQ/YmgE (transglycosylase-associated protein family)
MYEPEGSLPVDDVGLGDIIVYAIAGLVIGALARLILPGKQSMGWILTMVIGVISAIVGGLIWNAIFPDNEGIAWIGSLLVALVIIVLYERVVSNRESA